MIDQGFRFNAGKWHFPQALLRGIYARHCVYESVRGIESFEPWLSRIETRIAETALDEAQSEIPPEWYDDDAEPQPDNRRHAFVCRLFEDNRISVVPLNRVEKFAAELRQRLQ
jgi:hypothetical protein